MFELIAIAIALVLGFSAGLWDIRTSDIPDEILALMVALGVFLWYISGMTTGNWTPFIISAVLGTVVFAVGWGLYKLGQWGGGDAVLLAGIFFLLPYPEFMISYICSFLIVAIVYSVIYSVIIGLFHPSVFRITANEIKQKNVLAVLLVWILFGILFVATGNCADFGVSFFGWLWAIVFLMIIFYVYAKAVECNVFHRRIPISKLKIGDVIASSKQWVGVDAEQIEALRRKHVRTVEIKDGVRFGLVFPLTLVVTLLLGNVLFWLINLI